MRPALPSRPRLRLVAAVSLLAALLGSGAAAAESRTLTTAYGEVTIDDQPQRVVTLHEGALDVALSVGVTPVAAIATRGGDGVARYLDERADGIGVVGTARETNIEAVAAREPDLILASRRLPENQYELLSAIAPTVVPAIDGFHADNWKRESRLFGRALGHGEQVETAIERIESRASTLADAVAERFDDDDRIAVLARWMPQGPMVMSTRLFSTGLLEAAGFEVTAGGLALEGRPHSDPLSLESLSRIDEDWLFLATLNEDGREALDAARQSPAFERLTVVERDRVIPVDGQLWTSASGPLAANAVLDAIESAVLQ